MTRSGYCSSSQKTDFELPMGVLWLIGMASYADTAIACQDPKHSAPLFDRLAPYSDQVATTGLAVAFNDRAHAKFFAARTNLEWAKMLAARNGPGDTEHARDLIIARTAAAAHDYRNIERRPTEALQHLD
jgi:hypothetical protein